MNCPRCASTDLRWSETRLWELPLQILGCKMFRCRRCRYREVRFPGSVQLRVKLKLDLPEFAARRAVALLAPPAPVVEPVERKQAPTFARRPPGPIHFGAHRDLQPQLSEWRPKPVHMEPIGFESGLVAADPPQSLVPGKVAVRAL